MAIIHKLKREIDEIDEILRNEIEEKVNHFIVIFCTATNGIIFYAFFVLDSYE